MKPLGGLCGASGLLRLLGALLGASWGFLEASCAPGGFSERKARIFGSWSPSGGPLGAVLGRLGRLLGRLGALLGRLGAPLEASWAVWGRILGVLWRSLVVSGPSWAVLGPEKVTRQDAPRPRGHATRPGRFCNFGSGPLNDSSGVRTEAQGRVRGPEDTPTPCLAARWRIYLHSYTI